MNIKLKYRFIYSLLILFSFSYVKAKATSPGCKWTVHPQHLSVECYEKDLLSQISERPKIISECGQIDIYPQEDTYFEMGCSQSGFTGYFAMFNWEYKEFGDAGVDVTGAPAILVEGANDLWLKAKPRSRQQVQIVIPVEGYLSFNRVTSGGSLLSCTAYVNGKELKNVFRASAQGDYFSLLLHSGDVFTLRYENAGNETEEIKINNFRFVSNAIGVVKRSWIAIGPDANIRTIYQYVAIKKANITDVLMPDNVISEIGIEPEKTGFPLIDKDGIPFTDEDQYPITDAECKIDYNYTDTQDEESPDRIQIKRHWEVTDVCSGSFLSGIQTIQIKKAQSSPPSESPKSKTKETITSEIKG